MRGRASSVSQNLYAYMSVFLTKQVASVSLMTKCFPSNKSNNSVVKNMSKNEIKSSSKLFEKSCVAGEN